MAFRLEFSEPMRVSFVVLSVSETVGRSKRGYPGINRPDDVMLIQWFLARFLDADHYLGPPLLVDGVYGVQTDYHLCAFQDQEWDQETIRPPSNWICGESRTPIYPTLHGSRGLNFGGLMEKMGAFDPNLLPTWVQTMPELLQKQLRENVKVYPSDWAKKPPSAK